MFGTLFGPKRDLVTDAVEHAASPPPRRRFRRNRAPVIGVGHPAPVEIAPEQPPKPTLENILQLQEQLQYAAELQGVQEFLQGEHAELAKAKLMLAVESIGGLDQQHNQLTKAMHIHEARIEELGRRYVELIHAERPLQIGDLVHVRKPRLVVPGDGGTIAPEMPDLTDGA